MAYSNTNKVGSGLVPTQVMLRASEILNGYGTVEDVEPFLREAVASYIDLMATPRPNSTQTVVENEKDSKKSDTDNIPQLIEGA